MLILSSGKPFHMFMIRLLKRFFSQVISVSRDYLQVVQKHDTPVRRQYEMTGLGVLPLQTQCDLSCPRWLNYSGRVAGPLN